MLACIDERPYVFQRYGLERGQVHFGWLDLEHRVAPLGWHDLLQNKPAEEGTQRPVKRMDAARIMRFGQRQEKAPEQVRSNILHETDRVVVTIGMERMEIVAVEREGVPG